MSLTLEHAENNVPFPQPPPTSIPQPPRVERFGIHDLNEMGQWIATRVMEKAPEMLPQTIRGHLSLYMANNEALFIRYKSSVLLATLANAPFRPVWAEEIFCFTQSDLKVGMEEMVMLYQHLHVWMKRFGANRANILRHSDATKEAIQSGFGHTRFERIATLVLDIT